MKTIPERGTKEYTQLVYQYIKEGIEGKLGVKRMKEVFEEYPSFVHDILCKYILEIQPCSSTRYLKDDDEDICAYRGISSSFLILEKRIRAENRCAVGLFISDEEYEASFENNGAIGILTDILKESATEYIRLLNIWQRIHDNSLTMEYRHYYIGKLKDLHDIGMITNPDNNSDKYSPYEE